MGKSNKKNVSKQQKMIVKDITPELIASQSSEVENIENTLLEASDDTILEEAELSSVEKKQVIQNRHFLGEFLRQSGVLFIKKVCQGS